MVYKYIRIRKSNCFPSSIAIENRHHFRWNRCRNMDGLIASCTKGRLIQMGLSCAGFQNCWCDLLCCWVHLYCLMKVIKGRFWTCKMEEKIILGSQKWSCQSTGELAVPQQREIFKPKLERVRKAMVGRDALFS